MKTKIICPVDFSNSATNAVEYAAKLAIVIEADITLINVLQIVPVIESNIMGEVGDKFRESSNIILEKLKVISEETQKVFAVKVDYEVDVSTKSLAKTISFYSQKNRMIVMGTNGASDLSEFFFGTNTFDVIKKADCPVLMVPENCTFNGYNHILYPLIDKAKGKLALFQFAEFEKKFTTKITFLNISERDSKDSGNVFNREKEMVKDIFGNSDHLHFEKVFSEKPEEVIEDYIFEHSINLVVIGSHHQNFIERIFGKSQPLFELTAISPCPILVFHY